MKITGIKVKNFIGIEEFELNPGMVTILEGPKGSSKSSVLEAIETAATNVKRRTEVIRHNESEATLFLETDNGLEVDRRIRNDKADYLKLRKEGEGIKSTETELRKFINGDVFRPLDFINMKPSEQTQIILSMIHMEYGPEDFIKWFSSDEILSGINTDKHVLQILADIETNIYNERQEINRTINILEAQAKGIEKALPDNYDGDVWRAKSLQEAYNAVNNAKKVNDYIKEAIELKENLDETLKMIETDKVNQINNVHHKYNDIENDLKDIISAANEKISNSKNSIEKYDQLAEVELIKLDSELKDEIQKLTELYNQKKLDKKSEFESLKENEHANITSQNNKITAKQAEIDNISEKKSIEIEGIENQFVEKIETIKARVGKAGEYLLKHETIDIEPLQEAADQIAEMKEYLAEWDRMIELKNGQIAEKKAYSAKLTTLIETARNKPNELLKQHELPIDGIGVDSNGLIRINGTLLDGLSDGEKLEAAFKIALQRIGELRIMCLDGFEKLNETEQIKVLQICEDNDVQVFATITTDTESGKFDVKGGL